MAATPRTKQQACEMRAGEVFPRDEVDELLQQVKETFQQQLAISAQTF